MFVIYLCSTCGCVLTVLFCHPPSSSANINSSHNKNGGFTPALAPNNKITQGLQLQHPLENSKWPMKPGVQVHVNSLTSLPSHEMAQPRNNSDKIVNVTPENAVASDRSLLPFGNSEKVNRHHLNYIQALNQQKLYPSSTLDKRCSSSSSSNSSASSSCNLIPPRKILSSRTLPRSSEIFEEISSEHITANKLLGRPFLNNRDEKDYPSSDAKYYHTEVGPKSIYTGDKTYASNVVTPGTYLISELYVLVRSP